MDWMVKFDALTARVVSARLLTTPTADLTMVDLAARNAMPEWIESVAPPTDDYYADDDRGNARLAWDALR